MKLKNLNGALRKMTGAPLIKMATPIGPVTVSVQKTAFIEALKQVCPDPTAETHMCLDDDGYLRLEAEGRNLAQEVKKPCWHAESADMGVLGDGDGDDDGAADDDLLEDEDESLAALTNAASEDDLDGLLG